RWMARAIHRNSLRKEEAFVQVNCAAIPDELIESELFGHEKGSFTGATEKQIGKFELADKGTIFLDEVGEMSLRTQAKVLRVVQHFVKQFCAENNFRSRAFAPAAIEALKRHSWRGNVRELKNAVERLLIMAEGDEIRPEHVADVLRRPSDSLLASPETLRDFKE